MKYARLLLLAGLAGCEPHSAPVLRSLPELGGPTTAAAARVNGPIGSPDALPAAQLSVGEVRAVTLPPGSVGATGGDISLDFVDTDIREVVAQILGTILRVT